MRLQPRGKIFSRGMRRRRRRRRTVDDERRRFFFAVQTIFELIADVIFKKVFRSPHCDELFVVSLSINAFVVERREEIERSRSRERESSRERRSQTWSIRSLS